MDGTLLDSLADIAISMNEVLRGLGLPEFEQKMYGYFVGSGVDVLVKNVQNALHEAVEYEYVYKEFQRIYEGKLHNNTKPYDGIEDLLANLKGHNLAILSNKPNETTNKYAKKFFPNTFSYVFGQREGKAKKPDSSSVMEIINNFGSSIENTYFVGDTDVDMKTAVNSKVTGIGVLWGFRDKKELSENGADFIIFKPSEILDIIKS